MLDIRVAEVMKADAGQPRPFQHPLEHVQHLFPIPRGGLCGSSCPRPALFQGDVAEYARENGITDALVLYGVQNFVKDTNLRF